MSDRKTFLRSRNLISGISSYITWPYKIQAQQPAEKYSTNQLEKRRFLRFWHHKLLSKMLHFKIGCSKTQNFRKILIILIIFREDSLFAHNDIGGNNLIFVFLEIPFVLIDNSELESSVVVKWVVNDVVVVIVVWWWSRGLLDSQYTRPILRNQSQVAPINESNHKKDPRIHNFMPH